MDLVRNIDEGFFLFLDSISKIEAMNNLMIFLTKIGDKGALWIVIALTLTIIPKHRKAGLMCLIALIMGALLGEVILKNIIQRARPNEVYNIVNLLIERPTTFSFPSGHTTSSFAAAIAISLNFRKLKISVYVLAFLVSFSRLYLQVHFLSDIMAGILLGTVCGLLANKIVRKLLENRVKQ